MSVEMYSFRLVRALNGWCVTLTHANRDGDVFSPPEEVWIVPDGQPLGDSINAYVTSSKLLGPSGRTIGGTVPGKSA